MVSELRRDADFWPQLREALTGFGGFRRLAVNLSGFITQVNGTEKMGLGGS